MYKRQANKWGIESGSRDDPDFWEVHLPLLMSERAAQLPLSLIHISEPTRPY